MIFITLTFPIGLPSFITNYRLSTKINNNNLPIQDKTKNVIQLPFGPRIFSYVEGISTTICDVGLSTVEFTKKQK